MDISDLTNRAKDLIEDRGGSDALKAGEGSVAEKAKEAVEALKAPGSPGA